MTLPLHRLNTELYTYWLTNPVARQRMIKNLAKRYSDGVGLVNHVMQLFAHVMPSGNVDIMEPPFRRYERHEMANNPPPKDCECQNLSDPENNQLPYRSRGGERHHPFCQNDPTCHRAFAIAHSPNRPRPGTSEARPDDWERARKEAEKSS